MGMRKSDEVVRLSIMVNDVMPGICPIYVLRGTGYDVSFLLTMPLADILSLYALVLQRQEEREESGGEK